MPAESAKQSAVFFIDGANIYRGFHRIGIDANTFDLRLLAASLAGPARAVQEIRYYTGRVEREGDERIFRQHQRLLSSLNAQGVTVRLGRVEPRSEDNDLADELLRFLGAPRVPEKRLLPEVYRTLDAMARKHRRVTYWIQKAVDTMLVCDLARLASENKYDVAYVLSLDGDMTPGIEFARSLGKTVFGAGPEGPNYQVKEACNLFIVIDEKRLSTCYLRGY